MLSNLFSNAFLKKYQPHISTNTNPFTIGGEVRHQVAANTTVNPEPTVVSQPAHTNQLLVQNPSPGLSMPH